MSVVVAGNGILALMTAYNLVKKDPGIAITIIGPSDYAGCASLAAAAMFNSFCEVDFGTLENPLERRRFLFNTASNSLWPKVLTEIEEASGEKINSGFGTFLVSNHVTDELEDENFQAVIDALKAFEQPYESVTPKSIPLYKPAAHARAGRAIYIPREGWVNPRQLIGALKDILQRTGRVKFVDGLVHSLTLDRNLIAAMKLTSGEDVTGDRFLLATGATFSDIIERSNLGLEMPKVFYGIGCSVLLKTGEVTLKNCIRTPNRGLACGIYSAPHDDEHTLVGASNFISPVPELHVQLTSVHNLLQAVMEQINVDFFRAKLVKINVGWRPTSADTFPILGGTSIRNLWVATGTKRDGLHCSPIIGDAISALMLGARTDIDLDLYKPERKLIRHLAREQAIEMSARHAVNAAYQHGFRPGQGRVADDLKNVHRARLSDLHDQVGAKTWGIPPELIDMYRYGHIQ